MKTKLLPIFTLLLVTCNFACRAALACTDFSIKTTGGSVIAARSMEWGADLQSRLAIHARGEERTSRTCKGGAGLKWKSQYGYVGADACGLDAIVDGANEKGLSFGLLWFPDYTEYPAQQAGKEATSIDVTDLGSWILGSFESVEEVRSALGNVTVCATDVPSFGGVPTPHIALHDARGNNLVVEWIGGKQLIFDNPGGVLTNAPPFEWQLINLKNYMQINANNPKPIQIRGTILGSPGQGGGFLGIPGDWTPPSRFVRTTAMLHFAKPVSDTTIGINLAAHILNAVDIPRGDVREKVGGEDYTDYTQWVLIKDLTDKSIYFRSYDNLNLRRLDFSKLDFSQGQVTRFIPIGGGTGWQDVGAGAGTKK